MATRVEHELKYRIRDRATAERFLAAQDLGGLPAVGPIRTVQMEDRYLDTTDGALARAGYAARVRHEPDTTIVSVKALRRGEHPLAALHRREELEGPADRAAPPADWPSSAARALILELAGDAPLVEIVTIRQLRRRRVFAAEGAEVDLSVDDVDVVGRGDVIDRFTDLEVELRAGDPTWLERIAEAIEPASGVEPAPLSKYEAALIALGRPLWEVTGAGREAAGAGREAAGQTGPAGPAGPADSPAPTIEPPLPAAARAVSTGVGKSPGVSADDTIAEAGRKVLRFHFARLVASEDGTRAGDDPEDLHRMRVATRRLRAAWRIFGHAYVTDRTRRFPRELRALGRRLGAVRDADVLIEGLERYRGGVPEAEAVGLDPLAEAWRSRRETTRSALLRELDSDGYRRFIADFETFVSTARADVRPVKATEPHHVRDTAPSRIWQAYDQVRAFELVLPWADVTTLHELRIAAKWLRYSMEFVREALGPEAGSLVERVVFLQDHLGSLHDADVAAQSTRSFLVDRAAELTKDEGDAIAGFLASRERELAHLRRTASRPWRTVSGRKFRAALARCLARL